MPSRLLARESGFPEPVNRIQQLILQADGGNLQDFEGF
jgi:hypothetical protein